MFRSLVMVALAGGLFAACVSGGGPAGSTAADCKAQCRSLRTTDCYTGAEYNDCYDDCGAATGSEIERFIGCADDATCDPNCFLTTEATPEAVDVPQCKSDCDQYGADCNLDSIAIVNCKLACQSPVTDGLVADCLAQRAGSCDLDPLCAPPTDVESLEKCLTKCADLATADCVPDEPDACFGGCEETDKLARGIFIVCATKAISDGKCSDDDGAGQCVSPLVAAAAKN